MAPPEQTPVLISKLQTAGSYAPEAIALQRSNHISLHCPEDNDLEGQPGTQQPPSINCSRVELGSVHGFADTKLNNPRSIQLRIYKEVSFLYI